MSIFTHGGASRAAAKKRQALKFPITNFDGPLRVPMHTFGQALRYWLKLGFISFDGTAGQIAIMHKELIEKRRWISDAHFLHALDFCMLLPGPEAQQLATYLAGA